MNRLFFTAGARDSFVEHVSRASSPIAAGIFFIAALRWLFGSSLRKIPILGRLDPLISGLAALHNFSGRLESATAPQYFARATQPVAAEPCFIGEEIPTQCDLLVVGSGPGGAISANLSSREGNSVVVVESGSRIDTSVPHHSPEQMVRFFKYGGQEVILGSNLVPFAQGQVFGGGSEINSGLYHRLPDPVLETWSKMVPEFSPGVAKSAADFVEKVLRIEVQGDDSLGVYSNSPLIEMGSQLDWAGGVIPRWRNYEGKGFRHNGMSETFLNVPTGAPINCLEKHRAHNFWLDYQGVRLRVLGPKCQHILRGKKLCLAAGPVGTPELISRSGFARFRDYNFGFHAMKREVARYGRDVNDLVDIDPHQYWARDYRFKIGAAVGTRPLLASTLAAKGIRPPNRLEEVTSYYVSVPASGKGGLRRIGRYVFPIFEMNRETKSRLSVGSEILREAIVLSGGSVLGGQSDQVSTVHIFGSVPLGSTNVIDEMGNLAGSGGKVFVRDSSILPSSPIVNPQGPLMQLVVALERARLASK